MTGQAAPGTTAAGCMRKHTASAPPQPPNRASPDEGAASPSPRQGPSASWRGARLAAERCSCCAAPSALSRLSSTSPRPGCTERWALRAVLVECAHVYTPHKALEGSGAPNPGQAQVQGSRRSKARGVMSVGGFCDAVLLSRCKETLARATANLTAAPAWDPQPCAHASPEAGTAARCTLCFLGQQGWGKNRHNSLPA